MTTNVPTQTEVDPFDTASNPPEQTYDLFGKVEISAWACALVKGAGKVPFDPNIHDKRFTAIDIFIQPLAEIDVKYPKSLEIHPVAEFAEWAKIVLPSIKTLGVDNVREVNDRWAHITRVPTGKTYDKKDTSGNPTGEKGNETTFKFVQFFADENECRAAYVAAGGTSGNGNGNGRNVPTPIDATPDDAEKATAFAFLKVIVMNAVKGLDNWQTATEAVAKALAQYPTVTKFYTADSIETTSLITETNSKLLPF